MTPLTELQDFFAIAAENAARIFRESGEILPMWHAVAGNDEHILIATPWSSDEEKTLASRALRRMFKVSQVKRFAFISEAWVRKAASKQDISGNVGEHPDRREILMITAENREGNALSGFFYILRPEHGDSTLSPLHMNDYDSMEGRFTGLLR
jgi:hypothetical protein